MAIDQARTSQSPFFPAFSYVPLLFLGAWTLLYFSTFADLFQRWTKWDQDLSHGLPVMALFVYFLVKSLPWQPVPPSRRVFALLVTTLMLCSLLWFLFHLIHISIFEQLLLLPILVLALACLFGVRASIEQRFLLLLPLFAIPIWGSLNGVLLDASSLVVGELVRMAGMPARIEGNSIFIPYGHILIADGCSGLRYFVVAMFLGYLIAYLNGYREKGFLALLAVGAVIGLIANWLRIFILILIGYRTEMQSSLMTDHEVFGWVLFALLCLPALYFAPVVRRKQEAEPISEPSSVPKRRLVIILGALALGPVLSFAIGMEPKVRELLPQIDQRGVRGLPPAMPMPLVVPHESFSELVRLMPGVTVQIDQYQRTEASAKLVPYFGRLYDADAWLRDDRGTLSIGNLEADLSIFQRKSTASYIVQLQWFEVGEYHTTSKAVAKLLQLPAMALGQNQFVIVTLQSPCAGLNCDAAVETLQHAAERLVEVRNQSASRSGM